MGTKRILITNDDGIYAVGLKALEKGALLKDEKGAVQAAHQQVKLKDLAKGQWWWD